MGKRIDTVKGVVDIASTVVNAAVAIATARREHKKQKTEDDKDKKIRELERQLADAKGRP